MKQVSTHKAIRTEPWPGLPNETTIVVWQDTEGRFIPVSDDLGSGHTYDNPDRAVSDLARRHGYKLVDRPLKNGTTLIERRGDVVLAKTDGAQPYATWKIDGDGNTYWGHYFDDLIEAVDDFVRRSN